MTTDTKPMLLQPWQPLSWKPVYETMVALHMAGYKNVEIAALTDYHPVQVGNILRSDMAQGVIANLTKKIRDRASETLPEQIEQMRTKAFSRVKETLDNDDLADKNPHAMASTAMSFLKGIGSLSDGSGNKANLPSLPAELVGALAGVLHESNEIHKQRLLNASPQAGVDEGDYEVIESGSDRKAS